MANAAGRKSEEEAYHELQCYTLAHADPAFIHQHVVDAWIAQNADERTKPISLAFTLVGLHLYVERGFTGRKVQEVHTYLARSKQVWPSFMLPSERGEITPSQVIAAPPGPSRDRAIEAWSRSVWKAHHENHDAVAGLLAQHGFR